MKNMVDITRESAEKLNDVEDAEEFLLNTNTPTATDSSSTTTANNTINSSGSPPEAEELPTDEFARKADAVIDSLEDEPQSTNGIEKEPDASINKNVAIDPQLLDISQMESFVDISMDQTAYSNVSSESDLSRVSILTTTEAPTRATTTEMAEDVSTSLESTTIRKRSSVSDAHDRNLKITVPVPNAKEYDWSIVSSTASPRPPNEGDTTTKTPIVVRYFVKITRNPLLIKIPADEAYFIKNTTPMPLTSTTEASAGDIITDEVTETSEVETTELTTDQDARDAVTTDSAKEIDTFPIGRIPDFVPIGNMEEIMPIWKGDFFESAEVQDQEQELKSSITPKLFDETTAMATSENASDPFDFESTTTEVIKTSEAETPEPTTSQEEPSTAADASTAALSLSSKFSETFVENATSEEDEPLGVPPLGFFFLRTTLPPKVVTDDVDSTTIAQEVEKESNSRSDDSNEEDVLSIAKGNNAVPEIKRTTVKSSDVAENINKKFFNQSRPAQGPAKLQPFPPPQLLESSSEDKLSGTAVLDEVQDISVLATLPQAVASSAPKTHVKESVPRRLQPLHEMLVPVVPSVYPKRLQELPEMPQSLQEDLSQSFSLESPEDEIPDSLIEPTAASDIPQNPIASSQISNKHSEFDGQISATATTPSEDKSSNSLEQSVPSKPKQMSHELQETLQQSISLQKNRKASVDSNPIPSSSLSQEVPELPPLDTSAQLIQDPLPGLTPLFDAKMQKHAPLAPPVFTEVPPVQRYTTMKVETVKPIPHIGTTKKLRIKSPFIKPDRLPAEEGLWWTPRPNLVDKNVLDSAVSDIFKERKTRQFQKMYKVTKRPPPHPYILTTKKKTSDPPLAPLTTSSAVGQMTLTTLPPIEFLASRKPAPFEDVPVRKLFNVANRKLTRKPIKVNKILNHQWASYKLITASPKKPNSMKEPSLKKLTKDARANAVEAKIIPSVTKFKRQPEEKSNLLAISIKPSSSPKPVATEGPKLKITRHPPLAHIVNRDMDELELALKQLAKMDVNHQEQTSYFGDYRDSVHSVDGETSRSGLTKLIRPLVPRKTHPKIGTVRGRGIKKTINTSFKFIPPPPPSDAEVSKNIHERSSTLEKLVNTYKNDEERLSASKKLCVSIQCDYEKGDLCGFDSSLSVSITKHRKSKRAIDSAYFDMKRWTNWRGYYNDTNKRIDQAPVFSATNRRFAGTLLNGQQMATMSLRVITMEPITVNFDAWEATQQMQMRVCCDGICPLSNYSNRPVNKMWRRYSIKCPSNTHMVIFECMNFGNRRGACGIDNFVLQSQSCAYKSAKDFS
ncbi:unnamed protein product [Cylicocyclus nassatus]|uniref:Uncharacterized protein n=1 Tax=Cylicocyclus nassatus TaxID=53992 RepID=A0AA36H3S4_CYLNA|nr:unnamed protein product [Cylicocyclus nassatus]